MDRPKLEAIEQQLDELELLQSVFSQPGEFSADQVTIETSTAWLRGLTSEAPVSRLSCTLHLSVDPSPRGDGEDSDEEDGGRDVSAEASCRGAEQCTLDISMTLPHRYPDEYPEIYVSSNSLTRRGQDDLNADLKQFRTSLPLGEVCLLTIAEWVRDNAGSYFPLVTPQPDLAESARGRGGGATFCRLWLYMHHIYSKTKRRNILDLAEQLELTGFCLPGKPGVVCVEGDEASTRHFFNILRRWNWKSISCRHREEVAECPDLSSHRRLEGFGELGLATHGPRQNHMDMGQFRSYLEEHRLGHVFPILFGVEGQSS